ncbi:MAG TPA: hypothetical protein VGN52_03510 [Burkholderiales bacterium]
MPTPKAANVVLKALADWIDGLKERPDEVGDPIESVARDSLAKQFEGEIRMLLADKVIRARLAKYVTEDNMESAKRFLTEAAWICAGPHGTRSSTKSATRTENINDIQSAITNLRRAIDKFKELPPDVGRAMSFDYLSARASDGNRPGYGASHWPSALRSRKLDKGPTTLEYLASLADDLDEEVAVRRERTARTRQTGGKWANFRPCMSVLNHNTSQLTGTGEPDFLLAEAAMSVLCKAEATPDADTIRKHFRADAAKRKKTQA